MNRKIPSAGQEATMGAADMITVDKITVDTLALMAILLDEKEADRCMAALTGARSVLISSATIAEALIVAGRRGVGDEMADLIDGFVLEAQPLTAAAARRGAEVYARFGKGRHSAGLNFGDCFAYETANEAGCSLLSDLAKRLSANY
jgi:ribonuclease VapC